MNDIAKAMDIAAANLGAAITYKPDLVKAGQDAMQHHAMHAAAACKAGKMDEAAKHKFMHLRHALENSRDKGYHQMGESMRRNTDHHEREAQDEVGSSWDPNSKADHPAIKHFKGGGGFKPHAHDKTFKEDYKGQDDGPKAGKK